MLADRALRQHQQLTFGGVRVADPIEVDDVDVGREEQRGRLPTTIGCAPELLA